VDICEHSDEPLDSIKGENFVTRYQLVAVVGTEHVI
jgi:hypothetical protein